MPEVIDVDQDSDMEIVETPGVRRAQLERVSGLLEFYFPPTHVKGEVRYWFLSFSLFLISLIEFGLILANVYLMFEVRGRPPKFQVSLV